MIKVPSPTREEKNFSEFYAKALEKIGMNVELYNVGGGGPNVHAHLRGTGGGQTLLLHGHMDTVPIGNCVKPEIRKGEIFGRGSSDMKGSLAAIVVAVEKLIQSGIRLKGDLVVAGTVDHERPYGQGKGMKGLVQFIKKNNLKLDGAINTEGPFDGLKIAQGGCAYFTITIKRKGGTLYSATSTLASNSILWTSELIAYLREMDLRMETAARHPLIAQRPTIQFGTIHGGDFLFSVPNSVKLEGAFRWDPGETFELVSRSFEASLREFENSIRKKYDESARVSIEMTIDEEECEVPPDSRVVTSTLKALKKVTGRDLPLVGSRYVSDLSVLRKDAGIESVEYGPFLPDNMTAHTDHESVSIDNLEVVSKVLFAAAQEFCGTVSNSS